MDEDLTSLLTQVLQAVEDLAAFEHLMVRLAVCRPEEASALLTHLLKQLNSSAAVSRGLEVVDRGLETLNFAFLLAVEAVLPELVSVCLASATEDILRKTQLWALKYGLISDRLTTFHNVYIRLVQDGQVFPEQPLEAGLKHTPSP